MVRAGARPEGGFVGKESSRLGVPPEKGFEVGAAAVPVEAVIAVAWDFVAAVGVRMELVQV